MKKQNKDFLICIAVILGIGMYFSLIPYFIVEYGVENGLEGFDKNIPFYESYSVVGMAWFFGHIFIGLFILSLVGVYKSFRDSEEV